MHPGTEDLFTEICRSVGLEEDEMRKKWRRMGEEEGWGLVKEFVGHWGQRFHPLSARSVKEMLEEHVNEEEDRSFFFPGLKRWMGFPEILKLLVSLPQILKRISILPTSFSSLIRHRRLMKIGRSDAADSDLEDDTSSPENTGANGSSATATLTAHGQGTDKLPSSSSGAARPGHEFDVFLSFRGSDIRKTFADVLYHKLIDVGVHTFMDSKKLHIGKEIGPELMRAIEQSKVCIPIFTKGYAFSKWCLREVTEIMKLRKENLARVIIPILIDVTPDEVQHQTGSYEEAFSRYEQLQKLDPATIRGWRDALRDVLTLKGLELKVETNGKHGEFVQLVAANVLKELRQAWRLNEDEILVGLDHPAKEVMQMLDEDQMVGIWGTGGIGKTTLAKNIYNQIANGFECCCFLGDIRENSKNGGLLKLQEKLVSQLLGQQNHHFTSTDEGIDVLKSRVRGKKALILLDDVDAIDQIEALSADPNWFGKGSRILITTRDQAVLKQYEWCKIYEHKPLNEDLALKLFSKYAFKHELPTREFVDLSKDIVRITGRLPLTLKVTGSTLFTFRGKKDLWLDAKTKLKKGAHVAEDVRKKLMISYEYLDDDQKKIFLDIACFFIGTNYRQLIPMWENCGLSPTLEIEVLKYKSLIKIDDGNEIQMHDELRDLGRHIVDQQGRKPEQRSRLWRNREVFDILHGRKGTENIEGALISEMESRESLHDECFQNLSELRILIVHGDVEIVGDCQHLLPNLRWLRWSNRERYPPNNLPLNKLVVLDLSGCVSLDDDWIGWISIKSGSMGALTVLTIDGTGIQELPVSAKMKRLEFLSANRCRELDRIPESIGSLVNLKQLSLEQCTNLKKLPETIGKLRSLIELRLFDSRITCLPKTLEYLTNLEVMDARFCPSLYEEVPFEIGGHAHSRFLTIFLTKDRKLSDRISSFSHLHTLYLFVGRHWTRMDLPKLPSSLITLDIQGMRRERHIGSISPQVIDKDSTDHVELKQDFYKLEELRLMRVNIITLPKGISSFTRLKRVTIEGCEKLKCLPTLPSNLCHLIVENCQCLCELSDLSNLDWLLQLSISECPAIEGLPGLSKLQSLKYLHLIGCKKLAQLNGIGELTSLEELKIHDNEELKELSEPQWKLQSLKRMEIISCTRLTHLKGDLISLESLELRECNAIGELSKLSKMLKLQSLRIKGCEKLKTLDEIGELVSLQELGISRCSILELPELFKLVSLKFIVLAHCRNLTQLDGIQGLISLKVLIIHWCDKITRLGEMGELVSLRRLDIIRCNNIENLPETLGPSSLEELTISECKKLTRLGGIRDSVSLKELHIDRCKNIENLAEALKLQSLEKLKICGQTKMTPPGRIVDLVLLKELCINECENIENLVEALKLRSIEKLEIACCMKLTQLNGIVDLVSLKELHIFKCGNIGNLAEALKLPNLEKMHITCCTKLTQLSGIVDLVSLKELYIKQCVNLENLAEALNLPSLEELNIDDCEKLSKLGGIVNLVSLKELGISYCNRIENLPEVLKLESLKILKVTNCESLEGLDGIGESISLEELYIKSCGKVEELSNLSKLQSLRYLEASECRELTRLDGIGELVSLERLDIRGCEIIMEELPELSKLQSLKCLHMSLVSLTRLDRIGDLASLENLDMTHWRSIKEFPKLLNLVQLQELGMHHCESLNQLYGIRELVSLRSLSISYCRGIEMLPDLSQMCKLRKLSIEECENLIQLEGLELENLIHLEINGCCKLKDLPNISKLSRLLRLCIQGCHQLSHLEGLGELISLEYLIITRCEELEKLPDLSKLQLLECFLMINCKNIKGLQGFQKLSDQLEVIRIFRCPHLQYLSSYNCRGDVYYKDLNLFLSFKDLKVLWNLPLYKI